MSEDVIVCPHCHQIVRSKVCPECGGAKSLHAPHCLKCSVLFRKPAGPRMEVGNGWPKARFARRMRQLYGDAY